MMLITNVKKIYVFFFSCFFLALPVYSQDEGILNRLLAPGPLIEGHKNLEATDCLKCHDAGKGVPSSKCLDCHKEIKPFVNQKKGFHGLMQKNCMECHTEHKGRDYNTVAVDEKKFDHKTTGFDLEGKHSKITCTKCHLEKRSKKLNFKEGTRYFGKTTSCVGCHRKEDIHSFKGIWAKKDCNACHGSLSWNKNITFDHLRDTKYKLEDKHAEAKCVTCHGPRKEKPNSQYKWPQLKTNFCATCHEDVHKGNMTPRFANGKCNLCHTQKEWGIDNFDHKITQYELRGSHAELECTECHKQKNESLDIKKYRWSGLKKDCLSCHADEHQFPKTKTHKMGLINNCLKCHNETDWNETHSFEHNQNTRYIIDGKHEELSCKDCHFPSPKNIKINKVTYHWQFLEQKTCENCHKNPHIGQFKAELLKKSCTECHVTSGWTNFKNGKGIDHSQTRFPLTGKHTELKCNSCHQIRGKKYYKFPSDSKKFCVDCHTNVHTNQFSKNFATQNCTQCHTTKNFTTRLDFDHNLTQYKLKGEHEKLKCEDCHTPMPGAKKFPTTSLTPILFEGQAKRPEPPTAHNMNKFVFSSLSKNQCLECHTDFHRGQLGNQCLNCHSESKWKPVNFDHNKQSDYKLLGKHTEIKCSACHKPMPGQKVLLKKNELPVIRFKPLGKDCLSCHTDAHKGSFGNNCSECHTERSWHITRDFHKNFSLTGIHYSLECNECHKNNRQLSGLSQQCIFCHKKDDIHNGVMPNCGQCHRQQFWEYTSFKHSRTDFPLRGAHRTADCIDCHREGIYKGRPHDCYDCHSQDAASATSFKHPQTRLDCTECHHNQFSFKGGTIL